jgi:hypothetical protein
MTRTSTRRIGPAMQAAQDFVAANPGCRKLAAAEHIGPNGSRRYGYAAVDRAISAGLIAAERTPRGYRLTVSA